MRSIPAVWNRFVTTWKSSGGEALKAFSFRLESPIGGTDEH